MAASLRGMTLPVKIMKLLPLFRIKPGLRDVRNLGKRSKDALL